MQRNLVPGTRRRGIVPSAARTVARAAGNIRNPARNAGSQAGNREQDVYLAALHCCVFPILEFDASSLPAAAPAPAPAPSKGHFYNPLEFAGVGGGNSQPTQITADTVVLSQKVVVLFKTKLIQKLDALRMAGQVPRLSAFVAAGKRFKELHLMNSQFDTKFYVSYTDVRNIIDLFGLEANRAIGTTAVGEEHDQLLFFVMDMAMGTIREAISDGETSLDLKSRVLAHPILKPNEGFKPHVIRYTQSTRELRSELASTGSNLPQWVGLVFGKTREELQTDLQAARQTGTDRAAVAMLKRMKMQIEQDQMPGYTRYDFLDETHYANWRTKELHKISQLLEFTLRRAPKCRDVPPSDDPRLPRTPEAYYLILLRATFQQDSVSTAAERGEAVKLSKASKAILKECALRWRISDEYRQLAEMEIFAQSLRQGTTSISNVWKLSLKETMTIATKLSRNADLKKYVEVLKVVWDALMSSFTMVLEKPSTSNTKVSDELKISLMALENIDQDPQWRNKYKGVVLQRQLEESIVRGCDSRVNLIRSKLSSKSRHIERVTLLARALSVEINHVHLTFSEPISGINVMDIAGRTYMTYFKMQLQSFSEAAEQLDHRLAAGAVIENEEEGVYSIAEILELHKHVTKLYESVADMPIPHELKEFDAEKWVSPFVFRWLKNMGQKWGTWVENAVALEKKQGFAPFLPPDVMYSSSVVDLFTSFHAGLDFFDQVSFRDTQRHKDMMTNFVQMIKNSLAKYSEMMLEEFLEIMDPQRAKKMEDYSYESCMKLNNVIGACYKVQELFDRLNIRMDGEIKEDAQRYEPDPNNAKFQIGIVRAADLLACDAGKTSDPYVTIFSQPGKKLLFKSRVIDRTLNPVWNQPVEFSLPNSTPDGRGWDLDLEVWDADTFGGDDLCGDGATIRLKDKKYLNYLAHEERFQLNPQGTLYIRITRDGWIDDSKFYVLKAREAVYIAADSMVQIYTDSIVGHVRTKIGEILEKVTQSSSLVNRFNEFFSKIQLKKKEGQAHGASAKDAQITDTSIEDLISPLLHYLDRQLGQFNETLTPDLNRWLLESDRYARPLGRKRNAAAARAATGGSNSSVFDLPSDLSEKPSLLIKLIWIRTVGWIREEISTYGTIGNAKTEWKEERKEIGRRNTLLKNAKKEANSSASPATPLPTQPWNARGVSLAKAQLTAQEKQNVMVLDIIIEYLKALFCCEIDGEVTGFSVSELEDAGEYKKLRQLIQLLM
ncbi:hypothetical protein BJ742DRAFT_813496 [Cladochytrium replicatum]|nr:hypothetical protein BJ742DRAFT_813496 [Cladochytrium replicatum]